MDVPWDAVTTALLAGVLAGLGIALPLGAIGVLVVAEGLERGWRRAGAAATGVALVDFGYAALATVAGAGLARALAGWTRPVQLVGAAVLVAVGVRGLLSLRRTPDDVGQAAAPSGAGPGSVLVRFVALTAINPLTAVYFVVLAAGLGSTVAGPAAGTAFVLGVLVASLAWQWVLAGIGTVAGARLPPWARTVTGVVGYVTVLGYAVHLAA
jgi:threonine/homoserine/homoserine lactone efflux protein